MLEVFEMGEVIAERIESEEINRQMEELQINYNEALAGGYTDMAEVYQEKMKELAEKTETEEDDDYHQGKQLSFEGTLKAHQGMASEETSEETDCLWRETYEDDSGTIIETTGGQARSGEISFGSSDLKTLEARADKWLKDVEFHEGQIETNTKLERDTSKNMSDLKSAKRQYEMAVKELEWARKHQ